MVWCKWLSFDSLSSWWASQICVISKEYKSEILKYKQILEEQNKTDSTF